MAGYRATSLVARSAAGGRLARAQLRAPAEPCPQSYFRPSCSRRLLGGRGLRPRHWPLQAVNSQEVEANKISATNSSDNSHCESPAPSDPEALRRGEEGLKQLEQEVKTESAGETVAAWVAASVAFGVAIGVSLGGEKAEEFFAGYLLEQSLSVDNLFVFILIFKYFKVSGPEQEKVLTVGIWTAAVLRLFMTIVGVEAVEHFKPLLLVFAAILLFSSYSLLFGGDDEEEDMSENWIVKLVQKQPFIEFGNKYDGTNFFTIENGKRVATPLLLVLAVVEISDVVFAVDSIPAVFGVTLDPFIVYTSNMFAIANLRALYTFISVVMNELRFLEPAVAIVLGYIGVKMVLDFNGMHVPTSASLGIVASVLGGGVGLSYLLPAAEVEADSE